jgi:ParB family chromosome partitioning protein
MTGSNKRGPIKLSGLVASGKVQVREATDVGDEAVKPDMPGTPGLPANAPAANQSAVGAEGADGVSVAPNADSSPIAENGSAASKVATPGAASNGPAANQSAVFGQTEDVPPVALKSDAPLVAETGDQPSPDRQAYPITKRILLALVDDSPYQPRKEYDPELIDALATTMNTAGHAEPIRVRKKADGRYELIAGHRRKRAALSLGWTEIDAFVEEKDDKQAQVHTMLAAIGSHGLSDFELADLLRIAVDQKLVTNQRQLAAWSGLNLSKVNGCLQMLQLPPSILAYLHRKPSLFGYETSRVILGLIKEYPNNLADIERGVERIADGKPQNTLKGWVLQAIKGRPQDNPDRSLITSSGKLIFTTKRDPSERAVLVNCKSPDVDMEAFEKKLQAWLEEQASSVAASPEAPDSAVQAGSD